MPLTLPPPLPTREDGLTRRLDEVASRLRRIVILRAGSWLLALCIVFLAGLGLLDHRYQLPALVRILGLVTVLVGVPLLARRWITRPLARSGDRQVIALRVERAYPEFNDSLVSAVEFMDRDPDDQTTSVACRKMAIRPAARKAERYEFDKAVNSRGLKRSMFAALVVVAAAAWLVYTAPDASQASLRRIAVPFGGTARTTQTKLEILAPQPLPHRMARGEP